MNNHKYICQHKDLDLLLPDDVAREFREVFTGGHAWRMSFDGRTPQEFWQRFGVSFDHPTVRAAVAIDLIKIQDPDEEEIGKGTPNDISNDSTYHLDEHLYWSTAEHERWILNRNFRISLVNLENGWSSISYQTPGRETRLKRKVDRIYQGPRFSETFLRYFHSIFSEAFENKNGHWQKKDGFDSSSSIYVPFTNANDFINEISLIPNTHPDFDPIVSRSYYDQKHARYKKMLRKYGILAISTFALVDDKKDKTHTGEWLVKVQKRFQNGEYGYIVLKIDSEGQVKEVRDIWTSGKNEILSVCEKDFDKERVVPEYDYDHLQDDDFWQAFDKDGNPVGIGDIQMVKSTTSSHYSVFRQRIPDHDLKHVRNYIQFKNRLEGMELMLNVLKRSAQLKEVQASECFAKETMAISRLFNEFKRNEVLMNKVMQYYDLIAEYDQLYMKLVQIRGLRDERQDLIDRLTDEYNRLSTSAPSIAPDKSLDRKIELGQKIKSLKLEMDKVLSDEMAKIKSRLNGIREEVRDINSWILEHQNEVYVNPESEQAEEFIDGLKDIFVKDDGDKWSRKKKEIKDKADEMKRKVDEPSRTDDLNSEKINAPARMQQNGQNLDDRILDIIGQHIREWRQQFVGCQERSEPEVPDEETFYNGNYDPLAPLNEKRMHSLVLATERMKGYMQNMGYELMQMKEMLTMCEDATIKVRRLVHNFKERMERTEEDVWDESHQLRPDFDFKSISSAGIRDIILLHDWYACNAPGKTPEEMGMTEDEFKAFRKRCNTISYNLRKNQYAQSLAMKSHRLQSRIQELEDRLKDIDALHWKDKYGWEAKKEQEESESRKEEWSLDDVDAEKKARVAKIAAAERGMVLPTTTSIPQQRRNATISLFAKAERAVREKAASEAQYRRDASRMRDRTLGYLKDIGLIEAESDLESLATRNRAAQFKGDINAELKKVEAAKGSLDKCVGLMNRERNALKSIIDGVANIETRIRELEETNGRIFSACIAERNRQTRNRLLLTKLENETMIADLKQEAKQAKDRHLREFRGLERMRRDVDRAQAEYDERVREFKETIGSGSEAVENLMVGIYNRFQDEILKEGR